MSNYLTDGWPLGETSTVYMDGKALYNLRFYGEPGIQGTVALTLDQAEVLRRVVASRVARLVVDYGVVGKD